MKRYFWSLLATCAFTATLAVAEESDTPKSSDTPKKEKVTKMDGTSFFGIVTLTDDYTLKISNDSGIMKVPIALLGEKDFNKYLGGKDRSNDGKLWSERQDALEKQKEENSKNEDDPKSKNSKAEDNSAIEIQLGQIAVLQPVISLYESTLADKMKLGQSSSSDSKQGDNAGKKEPSEDSSPVRLFSGPGTGSLPGSSVVEPVMSIGSSVLQSAGGGVPSAPVGIPSAP
jgi:hypothetical protein